MTLGKLTTLSDYVLLLIHNLMPAFIYLSLMSFWRVSSCLPICRHSVSPGMTWFPSLLVGLLFWCSCWLFECLWWFVDFSILSLYFCCCLILQLFLKESRYIDLAGHKLIGLLASAWVFATTSCFCLWFNALSFWVVRFLWVLCIWVLWRSSQGF